MNFTFPAFLFALFAIAIPVIIHLFNFRKFKTVYFSNIRFLKEVKQETQSTSKLKHLLVLASRILAISFLVFAFAQPFIPAKNNKVSIGDKAISIFVDNSFSMDAINKNGTLLSQSKKRAIEIVSAYKPSDRFQLLTNDFEGKHQRIVNKEEFIQLLDEIKISPASHSISEITTRQMDALNHAENKIKIAYIISDFQKSNVNISQIKNDTNISFHFVPIVAAQRDNVYIDTCWFESPVRQFNQLEKLHVRIKNMSDKNLENNSIKLFINEIQKTPASFSVDKNSDTEVILSFASKEIGLQLGRIELNDYPVTFDDKFYFSFTVSENISVLSINSSGSNLSPSESPYLNKLFGSDSLFTLTNSSENKLDYSALSKNNLIILNELKIISSGLAQELKRFMNNGGSVLVFPNSEIDIESYKDFSLLTNTNYIDRIDTAATKVDKINLEHDIYKDVFDKKIVNTVNLNLPVVSKHYVYTKLTHSNEEYLLKLQNNDVLLSTYNIEKGKLYLSSVSLQSNYSNFAKHSLFVPSLYKIGIYSQNSQALFYTIGKDEAIESGNILTGENVFHIRGVNNNLDIIPEHKVLASKTQIIVHNQIINDGNYHLIVGNEKISGISFNFNRNESNLNCYASDELNDQLLKKNYSNFIILEAGAQSLKQYIIEIEQGKKLWKICIILTLMFLAAEVLLLRFMK